MKNSEIWKPIFGYSGYEVSSLGRVRSLDRRVECEVRGKRYVKNLRGRILKPQPQESGHRHVMLCLRGKAKTSLVHQLVMVAFVGPCPYGMEICHNDGDPLNNALSNLRYDTPRNNSLDTTKHGRRKLGEKSHLAKYTDEQILVVRQLRGTCSSRQAELQTGFPARYIRNVWSGAIRAHDHA